MTNITRIVRNSFIGLSVFAISLLSPVAVYAETVSEPEPCTPPSLSQAGVSVPTGSDAGMYHFDCEIDRWVSSHYTYNPYTNVTSPRDPVVYTYNDATGLWDVDIWTYVASKGDYFLRTSSVASPPAGAIKVGAPKPAEPPAQQEQTTASTAVATSTGASSTAGNAGATASSTTSAAITNNIGSLATSGNASVFANTLAGNATSGNALAMANVINMLQSSTSAFGPGGNAVTFVSDINGDVNGDLLLDPALIGSIQPASGNLNGNLTVNSVNDTSQSITNNIDLAAASGNATVEANTTAGNATSGSAAAVANVVNFLNSAISSGKSFMGVININGNLNGDILMPPNFIDQLIANNVPRVTINTDLGLTNNTSQSINNNVDAAAASGIASVDRNTSAGNASTGQAATNITAFNLTGSNVIGRNSLLVFVNVTGTWYGMIFNAPGASSAALGGGISSLSSNTDAEVNNNTNQSITNNIDVAALSGDASVSKNTKAGNATTGDAHAAVNLLNIASSTMSLADWFGILFINVFGTWNGSFGVNTSAGDPVAAPAVATSTGTGSSSSPASRQIFRFVASGTSSNIGGSTFNSVENTGSGSSNTYEEGVVLAATSTDKSASPTRDVVTPAASEVRQNYWLPALGIILGLGMLLVERIRNYRRA